MDTDVILVAFAGMLLGLMLGCLCTQLKTYRAGRESLMVELCQKQEYDFCAKKYELIGKDMCGNE